MNIDLWKDFVLHLQKDFRDFMNDRGYAPMDELGGDRHGSWVWTCVRPRTDKDILTRYISLALTPEIEAGPLSTYLIEITAGADDSMRYTAFITRAYRLGATDSIRSAIPTISKDVGDAFQLCERLTAEDLDQTYLRVPTPRS